VPPHGHPGRRPLKFGSFRPEDCHLSRLFYEKDQTDDQCSPYPFSPCSPGKGGNLKSCIVKSNPCSAWVTSNPFNPMLPFCLSTARLGLMPGSPLLPSAPSAYRPHPLLPLFGILILSAALFPPCSLPYPLTCGGFPLSHSFFFLPLKTGKISNSFCSISSSTLVPLILTLPEKAKLQWPWQATSLPRVGLPVGTWPAVSTTLEIQHGGLPVPRNRLIVVHRV